MLTPTPQRTPVCILGAGPHGLTMLLHLLHANPELRGRVTVLDPSGAWLTGTRYVAHHGLMSSGLPYDPPMSAAFLSFCRHLVEEEADAAPLPHRPVTVTREGADLRVERQAARRITRAVTGVEIAPLG